MVQSPKLKKNMETTKENPTTIKPAAKRTLRRTLPKDSDKSPNGEANLTVKENSPAEETAKAPAKKRVTLRKKVSDVPPTGESNGVEEVAKAPKKRRTAKGKPKPEESVVETNVVEDNAGDDLVIEQTDLDELNENTKWERTTYKKHELRSHIYEIPDTYIGSMSNSERQERVLDLVLNQFVDTNITIPNGMERLFIEIISNAGDNVERSSRQGVNPGTIKVVMDEEWITIRNGGVPILIEMHEEGIYNPQMIFGELLTSSNYIDDELRFGCGRNGYGSKLVNIFSKVFEIEVGDSINKKLYFQRWTENMINREEPIIKPYNGKSYVEVRYKLDFARFGYEKYTEEAFKLFSRHVADISFTCKVQCLFNEHKLYVQDIKEYAKLYFGHELPAHLIYYRWADGTETVKKGKIERAVNKFAIPQIELILIDTPDAALTISFANGMYTRNGGEHVSAAFTSVSKSVLSLINDSNTKKKTKNPIKLTIADVRRHMSLLVSVRVAGVKFDSQSKNQLVGPKAGEFKLKIPDEVTNWY